MKASLLFSARDVIRAAAVPALVALVINLATGCGRGAPDPAGGPVAVRQAKGDKAGADERKTPKKDKTAPKVSFSHPHGFYEAPFDLTVTASDPAASIRFTIDGTEPGPERGQAWTGPIRIAGPGVIRAVAFKPGGAVGTVRTATYLFPKEVLKQSPDGLPPAGWPYSWGQNRVDYGMDPRVVNDPRWKDRMEEALKSIPSFSLVMDLDDLFHPARGIYANAGMDGREAERRCSLELIEPDGTKGFQESCGVRIRGGFSRMPNNPKHAFRFFFRKEYGEGKLKYPLFGREGAQAFDGIDLRCSQNYSWSLAGDLRGIFLRDQFSRDLQLAMGEPAARGRFYHLYVNGQYWGLYNTCERPEASYAAGYFGGAKEDYDVIKPRGGRDEEGPFMTDGTIDAWKRLYERAQAGLTRNEDYLRLLGLDSAGAPLPGVEPLLDPVNLADYMLVILYAGNFDAPVSKFMGNQGPNNWYGIRSRKGGHGFKFFIWDAEHTLLELDEDRTGPFPGGSRFPESNPQWLWQQCLGNAEFRLLFADRFQRHCFHGGVLTPEATTASLMKRAAEIEKAVLCESARWGDAQIGGGWRAPPRSRADGSEETGPLTREDWQREVDRLVKEYFPKRTGVLLKQLWDLGLWPDTEVPVLSQHGGGLDAGAKIELKAPRGRILYTLDGSDPRLLGGKPSPGARVYAEPFTLTKAATVKARALLDGDWSPLAEASFVLR